jgi:hypothetical protein
VIAGSVIAAPLVAYKRARNNGAPPVSAINAALPDASITGIANALIVVVSPHVLILMMVNTYSD